jgi:hypothetical protein
MSHESLNTKAIDNKIIFLILQEIITVISKQSDCDVDFKLPVFEMKNGITTRLNRNNDTFVEKKLF